MCLFWYTSMFFSHLGGGGTTCLFLYMIKPFRNRVCCTRKRLLKTGQILSFNPIALRRAKIVNNFGPSECNRVKSQFLFCRDPKVENGRVSCPESEAGLRSAIGKSGVLGSIPGLATYFHFSLS